MARTSTATGRTSARSTRKAAPRRTPAKRGKTDALSILQEDHKRVQKLFKQFEKADREDSEALRGIVEQACAELELHAALEEELVYPALREAIDESEMELMEEAAVEHETAKHLIAQLRDADPGTPRYAGMFTVLAEYVKHHVQEEEKEIFKQARKAKLDFEALGEALQQRRAQMQGTAAGDTEADEDAPHAIPVKPMNVEGEQGMQPTRGRAARGARGAR